jgi:hypothetical protein
MVGLDSMAKNQNNPVFATVRLTSWSAHDPSAYHYYVDLEVGSETIRRMRREVTAHEAARINAAERRFARQFGRDVKSINIVEAGEETRAYESKESALQAAMDYVANNVDGPYILVEGDLCVLDPQEIVNYRGIDKSIIKKLKDLWKRFDKIGGYDRGYEEEATKLSDEWCAIVDPWRNR